MYIEIVQAEDTFAHTVPLADGTLSKTVLTLRIVDDATEKKLRKAATGKAQWDRGQRFEPFDAHKFINSVIDYAIVGWDGVRAKGADLPCTPEIKLLLPERVKTDVIRLCLGKDASERSADGEVDGDEKKS